MKRTQSCFQCGICCKLFLINLTQEEWLSGWYKTQLKKFYSDDDFSAVQRYGGNILSQKKDGGCIYLKNNLCSIHTRRPQSCRNFFCESTGIKFKGMIRIIKERRENDTMGVMLVDDINLTVIAGDGGNGAATFRRDALTAHGGPDGGNGGNGGDIYVLGSTNINDLREFRYKKKVKAENGIDGSRHNGFGKNALHKTILMPLGTEITDVETGRHIEITNTKTSIQLAHGGIGGRGNVAFKSPTNRTPRFAEKGTKGEQRLIHLELRCIADVGLIGLPNAGKSSLLRMLTSATPKIGDYPFTTLEPNIGMFGKFPIADIPGLIEGASNGKGLGIKFLKHIEKTKILVHCIDCTINDPMKAYIIVRKEFEQFNAMLLDKPEILFLNKTDLIDKQKEHEITALFTSLKKKVLTGSIYKAETIVKLIEVLTKELSS